MRPHYAYQFDTVARRFNSFRWLGISMVLLVGALPVELGSSVLRDGISPEQNLTVVEGIPTDIQISHGADTEGSPARDDIDFNVSGHRIHYNSTQPKYAEVVAAVQSSEGKFDTRRPSRRIESGKPIQAWLGMSGKSLELYKLNAGGKPVLAYADTAASLKFLGRSILVVGALVVALGLRLAYRLFRPRRRSDPALPEAASEPSSRELFLFDTGNRQLLEGGKCISRDSPIAAAIWAAAGIGIFICLLPRWNGSILSAGRLPAILVMLVVSSLGFAIICVHRRRLLPWGTPVEAAAECVSRYDSVDDDGSPLSIVKISFAFQSPAGPVVRNILAGPIVEKEFAYWPKQGDRFPTAVWYFGPDDYLIL